MQPNKTQVHVDKPLTDMAIATTQSPDAFVSSVLPYKTVDKQSDRYFIYDKAAFLSDDAKLRAAGTESAGGGFAVSNDTYYCDVYALHQDIDWDTDANADIPLNLEKDAMDYLSETMKIRREKLFAAACFKTGVWAEDVVGAATPVPGTSTVRWSDYAASQPLLQVSSSNSAMLKRSGKKGNVLILGNDVADALMQHPTIVDRIKHVSKDSVTTDLLASLFKVQKIVIAEAVANTTNEGKAVVTDFICDTKSALLLHVEEVKGARVANAVTRFAWTGHQHLPRPMGLMALKIEAPLIKSTRYELEMTESLKITGSELGVFFSSIVA